MNYERAHLDIRLLVNTFNDRLQWAHGLSETHWLDLLDSRMRQRTLPITNAPRGVRETLKFACALDIDVMASRHLKDRRTERCVDLAPCPVALDKGHLGHQRGRDGSSSGRGAKSSASIARGVRMLRSSGEHPFALGWHFFAVNRKVNGSTIAIFDHRQAAQW